jgi:hypothetical protein
MKQLTALLSILFVCACANTESSPKADDVGIFPALQNGRIADPAEYPASIWIGNCTAAVVGERVVQTASHCVSNGATIRFSVLSNQYTARCEQNPKYRGNATADWAYCLVNRVVAGIPYESIATDTSLVKVGMLLTLSGYGCQYWNGPLDGKYRVGESRVTRIPSGTDDNFDIETDGKAALCSGDSGGPAFTTTPDGTRYVVSANSRRDTSTLNSYLPFTAVPANVTFMKGWAGRNGVEICGVHANAKGCRNVTLPPPPPPAILEFTILGKTLNVLGKLTGTGKYTAEEARAEFQTAVNRLDAK